MNPNQKFEIQGNLIQDLNLNPNIRLISAKDEISGDIPSVDEMYSYAEGLFLSEPIDADTTYLSLNFTPPSDSEYKLILYREVSLTDIRKQNLDQMPGFRFSWYYTGMKVKPYAKYSKYSITKMFVRDK